MDWGETTNTASRLPEEILCSLDHKLTEARKVVSAWTTLVNKNRRSSGNNNSKFQSKVKDEQEVVRNVTNSAVSDYTSAFDYKQVMEDWLSGKSTVPSESARKRAQAFKTGSTYSRLIRLDHQLDELGTSRQALSELNMDTAIFCKPCGFFHDAPEHPQDTATRTQQPQPQADWKWTLNDDGSYTSGAWPLE